MATNGNAEIGLLDSYEFPPRSSSSPKALMETAGGVDVDVEQSASKPSKPKSASVKAAASSKGSGASSPEKPHSGSGASRHSPSKAYALSFAAKKQGNKAQSKNQDDNSAEMIELKKAFGIVSNENAVLKTKLRKFEEDFIKRGENEKLTMNTLLSNMKRKIQRLEETVKEKDCIIKVLHADAKLAKHEAKIAMESTKFDTAGKRGKESKEYSKTVAAKAYMPASRSANSRTGSDSAASLQANARIQSLVAENGQLKEKLHRALMINDDQIIENYENLSHEELVAEISKIKGEMDGMKTIIEKIQSDTELNGDITSSLLLEEMERMKSAQRKMKEDILTYYEALEKKEMEIQVLKEELGKERKERSANLRAVGGAIPKVPNTRTNRGLDLPPVSKALPRNPLMKKTTTTAAAAAKSKPVVAVSSTKNAPSPSAANRTTPKRIKNDRTAVTPPSPIRRPISEPSSPTVAGVHSPSAKDDLAAAKVDSSAYKVDSPASKLDSPAAEIDSPAAKVGSVTKSEGKLDLTNDEDHIEEFRQNLAAKKIQKTWKKHQIKLAENERAEKIQEISQNHAARVIQNGWRNRSNKQDAAQYTNDADLDNMVTTIQAVARGHEARELSDSFIVDSSGDSNADFALNTANLKDVDESATTIQSVARAHHHREEILQNWSVNVSGGDVVNDRSSRIEK